MKYFLCTFTNMSDGARVIENTIVRGTDKSDAGRRAKRKMRRIFNSKRAEYLDLWSTKEIETTF